MSKHEDELLLRLTSGEEAIEETARWFLRVCAADKLEWRDMSVLEVQFMKHIRKAFQKWWRKRLH